MATKRYKEGELGPGGFPVGAFANLTYSKYTYSK